MSNLWTKILGASGLEECKSIASHICAAIGNGGDTILFTRNPLLGVIQKISFLKGEVKKAVLLKGEFKKAVLLIGKVQKISHINGIVESKNNIKGKLK